MTRPSTTGRTQFSAAARANLSPGPCRSRVAGPTGEQAARCVASDCPRQQRSLLVDAGQILSL
jgi:hypothetical protein